MNNLKDQHEFSEFAARLFLKELGIPTTKHFIETVKMAWMQQEFELMPGAIDLLNYLKPKYKLGVISNSMPSRRKYEMVEFELLPYFNPLIISKEIGLAKPDVSIFELALKMANVKSSKTAFIDDRPDYLEGAYKAGIKHLFQVTAYKKYELYEKAVEIKELVQLKDYL